MENSERYNLTSSSENFNLDSKPSLLKSNLTGILEVLVTWQICGQAENPNNILTVLICPDFRIQQEQKFQLNTTCNFNHKK